MQAIVELTLETPFELGMIQIAWMKLEVICVYRNWGILELNDDFDSSAFLLRIEVQERMLVQP